MQTCDIIQGMDPLATSTTLVPGATCYLFKFGRAPAWYRLDGSMLIAVRACYEEDDFVSSDSEDA